VVPNMADDVHGSVCGWDHHCHHLAVWLARSST
jgi:hypothetical protein